MKYEGVCIAVKDVNLSKKFYQDLFDLEVFQDYGINAVSYTHLRKTVPRQDLLAYIPVQPACGVGALF